MTEHERAVRLALRIGQCEDLADVVLANNLSINEVKALAMEVRACLSDAEDLPRDLAADLVAGRADALLPHMSEDLPGPVRAKVREFVVRAVAEVHQLSPGHEGE